MLDRQLPSRGLSLQIGFCTHVLMVISTAQRDSPTRPIAQAATAITYFERTAIFNGQGQIHLSDDLSQIQQALSFRSISVSTTVRNYHLEDVVLDADTLLLFQGGLMIPETAYFVPKRDSRPSTIAQDALVRLEGSDDWVIGYNNAHSGYQHWLTQCIPSIDWSLRQPRARSVRLILPRMEMWQEDILNVLGYGTVPRLTLAPGTHYLIPHAEYSEFLNGRTSFEICLSGFDTARRILNRVPTFRSDHKVLYVPCSSPYYGTIQNEAEVVDLLVRRGVFVADRKRLSTVERITLFRNADVVIGALGQDLTDILFCKPGTLLWEWMPQHHQNASFNRLAQVAQVDYWGDLFKSIDNPETPGQWLIDLTVVVERLAEVSNRLARLAAEGDTRVFTTNNLISPNTSNKPLEDLMAAFESLGDNCEFGIVQRAGGAEPLGLLRFAGISFENLVSALQREFEGVGAYENITVYPAGVPGHREFMVHELSLDTRYHTFVAEGVVDAEELRASEARRLTFLRRKLLEDLRTGEKIWVWKQQSATAQDQVRPLLRALRRLGPNILLWVVEADSDHGPGSVELLEPDFMKGYIERFAPYESATDIQPISWFEVCQRAYTMCHPDEQFAETVEPVAISPKGALSAMEILAQARPSPQTASQAPKVVNKMKSSKFWSWTNLIKRWF